MRCWVDRQAADSVPVADRGLAFGDGAFETMRLLKGQVLLWQEHCDRLLAACSRLGLDWPLSARQSLVEFVTQQAAAMGEDVVVKLMLTRRDGRAYRPDPNGRVREIILLRHHEALDEQIYAKGIQLRLLQQALSAHPGLDELKHLNRLEQVLASRELGEDEFEALLCNADGLVIEGTRTNFVFASGTTWYTPERFHCGVRGTLLAWLLKKGYVQEKALHRDALSSVTAAAVINSVMGVVPVRTLQSRPLDVVPVLQELHRPVHAVLGFPVCLAAVRS